MKIKIEHISNTYNYGSCMMAITLIKRINSEVNNVEFYVDTATEEDLTRLKSETGLDNIVSYIIPGSNNIIKRIVNKIKRIQMNRLVENIKTVIVIGGDDISEYYGVDELLQILSTLEEKSRDKNIILLGQTMGPFTGGRDEIARKSLKNTTIYTRDDNCLEYLKKLNFKNVKKGRDLAFLELPMQKDRNYILNKYGIDNMEYVTVVPSGLTKCYTKNFDAYISEQCKIMTNLLNNKRLLNKSVVLLPHVLLPEHIDDRLAIKAIMRKMNPEYKDRIIAIDDAMLPSEARVILANGIFTITGRMHAAVSTFFMRKPAISLSYSVKYAGVIGNGLDMNELVIESADEEKWKNGEISISVSDKVEFVLDNYNKLIQKIDNKVAETSEISEEQLRDLISQIK